ncbi:hypothetical protein B0H13DRAFT_2335149 [Mycena leptocephala]|nr:hypothetical protein B0H13DRAFT_2360070 [Mycena leptocephala]KAJ7857380.1 hypothetical protein B0H13DRAFT_2357004 [Mycena leptocephala]KAJ7903299.1 hypothetical protein B0H13DRAFT_2335149 [Mycena leptocephala]
MPRTELDKFIVAGHLLSLGPRLQQRNEATAPLDLVVRGYPVPRAARAHSLKRVERAKVSCLVRQMRTSCKPWSSTSVRIPFISKS